MKKFITIACCLSMCAAMSVTAFGEELAGSNSMSIYATESETATVLAEMEQTNAAVSLQEFGVAVDADTTMPVYLLCILPRRVHVISPAPKFPIPVFVFQLWVFFVDHQAALPLQISHEA